MHTIGLRAIIILIGEVRASLNQCSLYSPICRLYAVQMVPIQAEMPNALNLEMAYTASVIITEA